MGIARWIGGFKKSRIGMIVLLPVRLPGAMLCFVLDEWTRRQQERAWRKHGLPMTENFRTAESFLPDPRLHH